MLFHCLSSPTNIDNHNLKGNMMHVPTVYVLVFTVQVTQRVIGSLLFHFISFIKV